MKHFTRSPFLKIGLSTLVFLLLYACGSNRDLAFIPRGKQAAISYIGNENYGISFIKSGKVTGINLDFFEKRDDNNNAAVELVELADIPINVEAESVTAIKSAFGELFVVWKVGKELFGKLIQKDNLGDIDPNTPAQRLNQVIKSATVISFEIAYSPIDERLLLATARDDGRIELYAIKRTNQPGEAPFKRKRMRTIRGKGKVIDLSLDVGENDGSPVYLIGWNTLEPERSKTNGLKISLIDSLGKVLKNEIIAPAIAVQSFASTYDENQKRFLFCLSDGQTVYSSVVFGSATVGALNTVWSAPINTQSVPPLITERIAGNIDDSFCNSTEGGAISRVVVETQYNIQDIERGIIGVGHQPGNESKEFVMVYFDGYQLEEVQTKTAICSSTGAESALTQELERNTSSVLKRQYHVATLDLNGKLNNDPKTLTKEVLTIEMEEANNMTFSKEKAPKHVLLIDEGGRIRAIRI